MKLKVVTLNLWLGGLLLEDVIKFLQRQDADIVLLQEVFNGTDATLAPRFRSMQVLQQRLPQYVAQDFAAAYRDFDHTNGKAQRGGAILSKFPIIERNVAFLAGAYSETYRDIPEQYADCPRELEHVVVRTPTGNVNIYNMQGVWDLDGDNYSERRQKMADVVLAAVQGKSHIILGGDTNAKPTNQAIKRIETELESVFKDELTSSFNMRRKDNPGYATAVVDMLFVSRRDMHVISHECPDVDISDHLPLVMEVEVL
ncbi:MAG TPA: endonuclease/exonuclease/phosphatase family protein [Candidatus Saccharimonadales bacterium]|nr:endonuclease/exonuclease/phosphatase family protein [Candidatus Saccharimonadales bacterium]